MLFITLVQVPQSQARTEEKRLLFKGQVGNCLSAGCLLLVHEEVRSTEPEGKPAMSPSTLFSLDDIFFFKQQDFLNEVSSALIQILVQALSSWTDIKLFWGLVLGAAMVQRTLGFAALLTAILHSLETSTEAMSIYHVTWAPSSASHN